MNQSYSQELRVDTSRIVIPVLTTIVLLLSLIFVVGSSSFWEVSHFWLAAAIGPLGGWIAWRLIKDDKYSLGIHFFLAVQYLMLAIILFQEWQPGSPIPYLFGILIVATAMLVRAENSFLAWGFASFITILIVFYQGGASFEVFLLVLGPLLVNLGLAAIAFLSAVEWQYAVETVSDLHRNVQRRRDELYAIQEEVKFANAKLEFTNSQLEKARQEALDERDIRTRFMNHVSHELRTPLNSIVNFAHIVRLGGRGPVSEGQIDYLERIEKSGWHLLSVLNDLLDMAQIQAGEFKLHLEICDLHALCEEAMTTTRGLLLESQVDLVRDYPEEWPQVKVDKMRVKQSLINLLGNAVKYTEEGFITLRVQQVDDELHLSVIDTGIGIAPEHHDTIFQEFKQVNESAARKRVGTGLGLPITRHLIERHGGRMFVTSEVGQGSCFTIVLPVYQEETETVAAAVPVAAAVALLPEAETAELSTAEPEPAAMFTAVPAEPPPTLARPKQAPLEDDPLLARREQRPFAGRRWGLVIMALGLLLIAGWFLLTIMGEEGDEGSPVAVVASATPTVLPPTATVIEPSPTAVTVADVAESPVPTAEDTATAVVAPTQTATHTPTPSPTMTASPSPSPTATTTETAAPTDTPIPAPGNVATAVLNSSLYRQPDAASEEVTFINAGDAVTVLGRSANGNWLYVQTAVGDTGFVFSERLDWGGDVETLPVISSGDTAPPPVTGPLSLDLYLLTDAGRCEGQTWYQTVFMRGQGGNGRYTYFWNGEQIAAEVVNDGVTVEISYTGGAQAGVGEVVSGDSAVSKTLFIAPPDCN
jgi:signal transduction histidine kinase